MELLEFPTWLRIKEITCSHVSIKVSLIRFQSWHIRFLGRNWRRSRFLSYAYDEYTITVQVLESVVAKIEVLKVPRKPSPNSNSGYRWVPVELIFIYLFSCVHVFHFWRLSEGKYGFVDRVIDGISMRIDDLHAELFSETFKCSVKVIIISDYRTADLCAFLTFLSYCSCHVFWWVTRNQIGELAHCRIVKSSLPKKIPFWSSKKFHGKARVSKPMVSANTLALHPLKW